MTFAIGDGLTCDLDRLVDTRLLVQANSGGGKSWCLRRILEQTHGKVQHLVIDPEGEFASLRERFDYVHAAKSGADTAADPRAAALLAERLLELKVSAVLDIYELKAHERVRFVRLFLEALINAPKTLWHPALVVVDEAHVYCLDADTELLTSEGWVRHTAIHTGTRAAAFNLETGEATFEPVQAIIRKHFSGRLVHLESDGIDCRVTPDHRVVLRRGQRAAGRVKKYPWAFELARSVPHHVDIPIGVAPVGVGTGVEPDFYTLIGWVATDGSYSRERGICISQAVTTTKAGKNIVRRMDVVLARLGCKGRYERTRAGKADSVDYYLGAQLTRRLLVWFPDGNVHRVPRGLIEDSSRVELELLYEALFEGDGTAQGEHWKAFYPGMNEGLADDFQEIATRLGISTVKKLVPQTRQWVVLISRRQHHYIRKPRTIEYDGTVWCITVPSGAFVARRNGKVFVTGNCPQTGEAESASAVKDLATRGRKRGFCAVLATQRLSKLHKDAAAECNNKLIGRTGLDVDMKRAADELGLVGRDEIQQLRALPPGAFFAFGPAFNLHGVTRAMVGAIATTHPKAGGHRGFEAPPPTSKIKALLPSLADLPAEAADRERSLADLKTEIATLKRDLTLTRKAQPTAETKVVEKFVLKDGQLARAENILNHIEKLHAGFRLQLEALVFAGKELEGAIRHTHTHATNRQRVDRQDLVSPQVRRVTPAPVTSRPARLVSPPSDGEVPPARQKILNALAFLHGIGVAPANKTQLALLVGVSPTSGGYFNNLGKLRSAGLVDYPSGGTVALTDTGVAIASTNGVPTTTEELHEAVKAKLPPAKWRILEVLIREYPRAVAKDALAETIGVSPTSGGYFNNLGSLRSLGLVDYPQPGAVAAQPVLFLEEA